MVMNMHMWCTRDRSWKSGTTNPVFEISLSLCSSSWLFLIGLGVFIVICLDIHDALSDVFENAGTPNCYKLPSGLEIDQ